MNPLKIHWAVLFLMLLVLLFSEPAIAQQAEADVLLTQATLAYDDLEYDKALSLLNRVLGLEPRMAARKTQGKKR